MTRIRLSLAVMCAAAACLQAGDKPGTEKEIAGVKLWALPHTWCSWVFLPRPIQFRDLCAQTLFSTRALNNSNPALP